MLTCPPAQRDSILARMMVKETEAAVHKKKEKRLNSARVRRVYAAGAQLITTTRLGSDNLAPGARLSDSSLAFYTAGDVGVI